MIVAVAIGDIAAAAIVEFDFEPMTLVAGVIDGVEVVDGPVGDAGPGLGDAQGQERDCGAMGGPAAPSTVVRKVVGVQFHVNQGLFSLEAPRDTVALHRRFFLLLATPVPCKDNRDFIGENGRWE